MWVQQVFEQVGVSRSRVPADRDEVGPAEAVTVATLTGTPSPVASVLSLPPKPVVGSSVISSDIVKFVEMVIIRQEVH